jgi:hypothetical protein
VVLPAALEAYEEERRTALLTIQTQARISSEWFENVPRHVDQHPLRFAYSLLDRRGGSWWYYPLYLATQQESLRGWVRRLHSAKRWAHSRRRGELAERS